MGKPFDLMEDPKFVLLFKHCKSHYKRPSNYFPNWDPDKVILHISSVEYNTKCKTDFVMQGKKTLFLMALACPKRIAEFHATSLLESSISTVEVILRPHLGVTAKNHSHCFAPEEIVIKPLENKLLCPVQAILDYIENCEKTCKSLKLKRPSQLWMASSGKPLSQNQLRHWFRSIILEGDTSAKKEDIRFHSARGLAATNLYRHFGIETVLKSLSWKSDSTFKNHYYTPGLTTKSNIILGGQEINRNDQIKIKETSE